MLTEKINKELAHVNEVRSSKGLKAIDIEGFKERISNKSNEDGTDIIKAINKVSWELCLEESNTSTEE